jgi:putative acetyltransferase
MEIIEYSSSRAKEITDLFYSSVHAIDSSIYSDREKHAWAPKPIDYDKWKSRLDCELPTDAASRRSMGFYNLAFDG